MSFCSSHPAHQHSTSNIRRSQHPSSAIQYPFITPSSVCPSYPVSTRVLPAEPATNPCLRIQHYWIAYNACNPYYHSICPELLRRQNFRRSAHRRDLMARFARDGPVRDSNMQQLNGRHDMISGQIIQPQKPIIAVEVMRKITDCARAANIRILSG